MSLYTYIDARQQFDHLFDEAKEKREVMIQRPNGDLFLLRLVTTSELKQRLPQLGFNLSRQEIVESIREVRERLNTVGRGYPSQPHVKSRRRDILSS